MSENILEECQTLGEGIALVAERWRASAEAARKQVDTLRAIGTDRANVRAARLEGMAVAYEEHAGTIEQIGPALDVEFAKATANIKNIVDLSKLAERGVLALEGIWDEMKEKK